jgi:branched-chain amino acid transport system substrate-binding protein
MTLWTRRRLGLSSAGLALGAPWQKASGQTPPQTPLPEILIGLVVAKSPAGDTEDAPGGSEDGHDLSGLPPMALRARQKNVPGSIRDGVAFAIAEVNARGGVLGRRLRLVVEEIDVADRNMRRLAVEVARRLVAMPGMIAVIGHNSPDDALPASITYFEHGILFIAPTITLSDLNGHGLPNVFATIPDNKSISKQTATFLYGEGLRRIAVLRTRSPDAAEQSLSFLDRAASLGMTTMTQMSYVRGRTDFRDLLANLRATPADLLLISAPASDAVRIIRQSFELRIPVTYAIGGLRDPALVLAGAKRLPVTLVMPVLEDPSIDKTEQKAFNTRFLQSQGRPADDWVWQGHDTVGLLVATIEQTRSVESQALIATLRYAGAWSGLMGQYSFERSGRVYTRHVAFAQMKNGDLNYFDMIE